MHLSRFKVLAMAVAVFGLLLGSQTESHAARSVNAKYYSYFPANSEFVAIVGPLGALQQRSKMILNHLKRKSPVGAMLPMLLGGLKQRLGFDILDPATLSTRGLNARTQLWFTGVKLNAPEHFLGLIAPCDPVKVATLIQKASGGAPVHVDKYGKYKLVTLYNKPAPPRRKRRYRRRVRKAKGYTGITYIARGKGVFFVAWSAGPGVSLTVALKSAKANLIAALARKGATLANNKGFRKAIKMARRQSSVFLYLNGSLLKGSRGRGLNQLANGVLRQIPNNPFGRTLRKRPEFKWGFVELRLVKEAIDLRAFVAIPKGDKDFKMMSKVFRTSFKASKGFTNSVNNRSLATGKIVVDILGAFKSYVRSIQGNPAKQRELNNMRRDMKKFQSKTGLDPVKDVMGLFTGHAMLNLYSISPGLFKLFRTPKHKLQSNAVGNAIHAAIIFEVKSNGDANKVLARVIGIANQKARRKITSHKKYGSIIYELPISRRQSGFVGVLGKQVVLALNTQVFGKIAQLQRKGGTSIRLLQRAVRSRQGGLLFINSDAIRATVGKMNLPFGQRMIVANIAQYLQGILGIYAGFTVRRSGIGFGMGIRLAP